jgi:hypothetical protein
MNMKRSASAAVGAVASLVFAVLGSCSYLASSAAGSTHDWEFVQSVGGISVGTPQRDAAGNVTLPINCDVSGTRAITVNPTAVNSGLVCEEPSVRVQGQSVYLTICTSIPSERYTSAQCPHADLGRLVPGRYAVFYGVPPDVEHSLGTVEVPAP